MAIKQFGSTPGGDPVWIMQLEAGDVRAEVITYGATIHKILAPDRNGKIADVILGKDDMAGYAGEPAPAAAVIGRVANRIKNHSFSLNGKRYILDANEGKNTLHGGCGNYAYKNFAVVEATDGLVRLAARDGGEAGFPGEVAVEVCYSLYEDGTLLIEYSAIPTYDTPINLTNHVYFNLAGQESGTIDSHALSVDAGFYTPADARDIPTGEILKTSKTPFDFTKPQILGDAMAGLARAGDRHGGYDHNFVLNGIGWRKVAEAKDGASGRAMEVYTDLPGMQLYTANMLKAGTRGKGGVVYGPHSGFCLETQFFPDTVHKPHFPGGLAPANELFTTATAYRFFVV